MTWTLAIHLKSGRDETVGFESQDDADSSLAQLMAQMKGEGGLTTIGGNDKLLIDTSDVETASVYEASY
jgi:hypothetical protein